MFNVGTEDLTLLLNAEPLILPAGTADPGHGAFRPGLKLVPRDPAPQPGRAVFGGTNTLQVMVPGQPPNTYQIQIPATRMPLNQDIQLWIYYTGAVLSWSGQIIWQNVSAVQ